MIRIKMFLSFSLLSISIILNAQVIESVLSNGQWYKLPISQSGVYKIDANYLSSQNIDIPEGQKLHIYGQKGGMLPEKIADKRTDDLVSLPLYEVNISDGPLLPNSAIYFYAEGASVWSNSISSTDYQINIYDVNNYVYFTFSTLETKKLAIEETVSNPEFISSSYQEIQRFEEDKANPLGIFPTTHGSGQEWYGDEFSNLRNKDYSILFDLSDILLDKPIQVRSEFISRSSVPTIYELTIGNEIITKNIGSVRTGDVEAIHGRKAIVNENIILPNDRPEISIHYPPVASESKGWIDFIELKFRRTLALKDNPIIVRDPLSQNYSSFGFEIQRGATDATLVWDITNPEAPTSIALSENNWAYATGSELKSFLVFDPNQINVPNSSAVAIENQNLHGIVDADLIIVYHKNWKKSAQRLAEHRRDYSNLNVEIVDVEHIYNEFSSGRQDASSIRDFAKMVRDRSENFRYLLLLGDGSYDFRGIDQTIPSESFVPTYETHESLDPLEAFPSDDYFAQLDYEEGEELRGDLDIAVGRLPARTVEEAENFVNKIIAYDLNKNSFGEWRSRIAFLADDEDSNLHLNDADVIASKVSQNHPLFNQKKIYWDAFQQESTPGGNRYPAANEQLNSDIEAGLLVVNYLGHGGPKGWSQERVLNLDDITSWSNLERLPLVITATCSFTGFDDPSLTTAGEAVIHNPTGGAIALFTTVRSVYASQNFRLTSAVFDTIFTKVDGEYMTIGEVMQSAKNTRINDVVNARKFFLIGDPSMKLAIPRQKMVTTIFNGNEVNEIRDTIGALQRIKGQTQVLNSDRTVDQSFNGIAEITLFDKASDVKTLRNDPSSFEKSFKLQKNILYSGKVTVQNGVMDFEFILPLDINYEYGLGRLSYYAVSDKGTDAAGYFEDFVIGGTSNNGVIDNEGPIIDIFLNSKEFTSGDQISLSNPIVFAEFFDESGINVSNVSIGHEIVSFLDNDTRSIQVLNQRYTSETDDFTSGNLNFRLDNLVPGVHTLTIRAFDVLNNAGSNTIDFEVVENFEGFLQSVFAYPNPFKEEVNFNIENELGETVDVDLRIYSLHGQLVYSLVRNNITNDGQISNITWDGERTSGPVSGGIYMYEVQLTSQNGEKSLKSGLKKIIMLK